MRKSEIYFMGFPRVEDKGSMTTIKILDINRRPVRQFEVEVSKTDHVPPVGESIVNSSEHFAEPIRVEQT